ncbi:MAG: hypothetical protein JXR80_03315, partial [Deltaproteobacteria bacterium]|nr:hypothetical protein [Deltaproteobacteria bacterium]
MSINKGLFFLLAVLLILPLSGLALAADPELNGGPVAGADAEADAEVSDTMPCQQVVDLENEFMVQRLQLLQEIES